MARVTVEDCIEVVPNRFDLVVLAARRAREIAGGATITVSRDNDKDPVISLREIAAKTINVVSLQEQVIRGMQRIGFVEENLDEEVMDGDYVDAAAMAPLFQDLGALDDDALDEDELLDDEEIDDEELEGDASEENA